MRDQDFDDPQSGLDGTELHLQGPSPVPVVHLQAEQGVEPDRTEGGQVEKAPAPEESDRCEDQSISPSGVSMDVPGISSFMKTGTQDQVGTPGKGCRELVEAGRVLRVVGIHEDQEPWRRLSLTKALDSGQAGGSVPPLLLVDHRGAELPRDLSRPVHRSVVDHDHRMEPVQGQRLEDLGKGLFLVEGRDENGGF